MCLLAYIIPHVLLHSFDVFSFNLHHRKYCLEKKQKQHWMRKCVQTTVQTTTHIQVVVRVVLTAESLDCFVVKGSGCCSVTEQPLDGAYVLKLHVVEISCGLSISQKVKCNKI